MSSRNIQASQPFWPRKWQLSVHDASTGNIVAERDHCSGRANLNADLSWVFESLMEGWFVAECHADPDLGFLVRRQNFLANLDLAHGLQWCAVERQHQRSESEAQVKPDIMITCIMMHSHITKLSLKRTIAGAARRTSVHPEGLTRDSTSFVSGNKIHLSCIQTST